MKEYIGKGRWDSALPDSNRRLEPSVTCMYGKYALSGSLSGSERERPVRSLYSYQSYISAITTMPVPVSSRLLITYAGV